MRTSNFRRKMGYWVTFHPDHWGTSVSYFYTKGEGVPLNAAEWVLCAYVD